MFKLIVVIFVAVSLFAGFTYFMIYQQSIKFTTRIQQEALDLFDRRDGLGFVEGKVKEIAKSENIKLIPDKLVIKYIEPANHQAAAAVGVMAPDTGKETLLVTTTFTISRSFISKTFTRSAKKLMTGADRRPGSHKSAAGFGGVNLSRPSRDIGSHRKSIKRAVGGRNP